MTVYLPIDPVPRELFPLHPCEPKDLKLKELLELGWEGYPWSDTCETHYYK